MICTEKKLQICKTALICNLVFIWGNSLLPGEVSGAFSAFVGKILELLLPEMEFVEGPQTFPLRKIAHFTEFAVLGALLGWLYGMLQKRKYYPFVSGIAAACVDETIQLFVPGRGPALKDVLIDSSGVVTGILLLWLGYACNRNKHNSYLEER